MRSQARVPRTPEETEEASPSTSLSSGAGRDAGAWRSGMPGQGRGLGDGERAEATVAGG